jgi:hypothetical protein|nr:MAG TPA: hypothetical protein [Caudoviricetes sp.]
MNLNDEKRKQYEDQITTCILIIQNLWSMRDSADIMDNQYRDVLSLLTDVSYGLSEIMANQTNITR